MPKAPPLFWPAPRAAVHQKKKKKPSHFQQSITVVIIMTKGKKNWKCILAVVLFTWRRSMYLSTCFSENRGWCCREQHTLLMCKEASLRSLSKHLHSSTVCWRAGLRSSICKLQQMKNGCIWRCKISDTWRIYSVFLKNRFLILKKYMTLALICFNIKMKE